MFLGCASVHGSSSLVIGQDPIRSQLTRHLSTPVNELLPIIFFPNANYWKIGMNGVALQSFATGVRIPHAYIVFLYTLPTSCVAVRDFVD